MDRLEAMAILIETIERGSLSAAGRKLGMPVPTLSRKISELEAHLGTRLLHRTTRRIELTDAGAAYLVSARQILEQVGEAEREAASEYIAPKGELVITAAISFGRKHVLPLINAFLAQHPEISIRLGLSDQRLDLVGEHVDLAVRIGDLSDSGMVATRAGELRWVVVGSPDLLAAHGTPRTPEEVSAYPCVGIEPLGLADAWLFRNNGHGPEYKVPVRCRLAVTNGDAAVDAAIAGAGLSQCPLYQAADALASGALRAVLTGFERSPVPVSILYTGRGRIPLKSRSFLDFAAPRLPQALASLPLN
jgi:DNA-binding transcriptional LysR family regulator